MKITVEDVAIHAGVSRATAARILGGYAGPRTKSKERVLASAKELGYLPNNFAKGLAKSKSNKIGIIIPDIENLFFAKLYRGIESICSKEGFSLLLGISGEDNQKEARIIKELLADQVEGIIIASTNGLFDIVNYSVPIVAVDRIPIDNKYSWVSTNNYETAHLAINHLHEQGYRHISLITDFPHLSTIRERKLGIVDAAKNKMASISTHITTSHKLEEMVKEIKGFIYQNKPEAIIATDSVICNAILIVIKELGLQLGRELGLLAYDDEPWMQLFTPSISTIQQPVVEMGEKSALLLLEQLFSTKTVIRQERLHSQLIIRESTNRN
ncbi:LacI family DNA-binding transcriptional regulator [Bacillus circulans]|uniref:LacI family DNA-binding transcriptional regulator n=1 Tax=Niallia circulans TaxID=1397 RepID=UPI00156014B9|nr:LacI family DNA-binding transcriptional regulator [Niallia circulans]NRG28878.1 LacI family DNA-binding transcriptional regulator [Niallia circulans]